MDLSSLTVVELRDLQQQIPAELKRREAQDKVRVLNEARAFVKARGYALEELVGKEAKAKGPTGKVKVKYRHPDNAYRERHDDRPLNHSNGNHRNRNDTHRYHSRCPCCVPIARANPTPAQ